MFKSFLGAVARYIQILSQWPAMATPFVSKVIEKSRFSDPGVPGDPAGGPRRSPGRARRSPGGARGRAGGPRVRPGGARGGGRRTGRPGSFLGACFPNKLAEIICPAIKKIDPGTQPRQSNSVNVSRTQSTSVARNQTQPAVPGKVVFSPRPGSTLLHAPETKMT